jgi:hypothetical protein
MHHEQRSAAIFKWSGDIPDESEERDPERLTTLTARAPARAILDAVRSQQFQTNVEVPYDGEGGCHFTVTIAEQAFGVFILWTAIGHPESHYFSIQVSLHRGIISSLFRQPVRDERLEPICQVLDRALAAVPLVSEPRWLTWEQFRQLE